MTTKTTLVLYIHHNYIPSSTRSILSLRHVVAYSHLSYDLTAPHSSEQDQWNLGSLYRPYRDVSYPYSVPDRVSPGVLLHCPSATVQGSDLCLGSPQHIEDTLVGEFSYPPWRSLPSSLLTFSRNQRCRCRRPSSAALLPCNCFLFKKPTYVLGGVQRKYKGILVITYVRTLEAQCLLLPRQRGIVTHSIRRWDG